MLKKIHYLILCFGIIIDQLSKYIAENHLSFYKPLIIIKNYISFQLVHNKGAAYGILQNQRLFLLGISIIIIVCCIIFKNKIATSPYSSWGLTFLFIGAGGNFIDRLFRGYVVDFIDIKIFPVFNIADISIDIAILFFILEAIFFSHENNHTQAP